MNQDKLLEQINQAVREVEPNKEIILYGSRSRGDAFTESNWDGMEIIGII